MARISGAEAGIGTRYWALLVMTIVYTVNIADRFVMSTFIEPIKAEFHLSDSAVGFLTGVALALFYVTAGIPLGAVADRVNRRNMIALALAAWSVMTALCGAAHSFVQLLLARIGVGIGEAGGTPPSQSLVADYFSPSQRIVAMSVYSLGIAAGTGLGNIGGGVLADRVGWRMGLYILAAASIPVLVLLAFVKEPVRGSSDAHPLTDSVDFGETMRFILSQRALVHIIIGSGVATFAGMGLYWWTPAFLVRSHGMTVGQAGTIAGVMGGLGGAAAMIASTLFMLWLQRFDAKWQCRYTGLLTLLLTIPAVLAHATLNTHVTIWMLWLFVPFINVYVGPSLALTQNLVRPQMRGVTVAIVLFSANIFNLAVAPQLIGIASDLIAPHLADPRQSLRIALAFSALAGVWAAYHYWAAERTLTRDIRNAGAT